MRYLVTGGAGFIGNHLARRLAARGETVTVLDDLSAGEAGRLAGSGVRLVRGDAADAGLVARLARRADRILHLAAVVGVRLAMADAGRALRVSFAATEAVLEAATRSGKEVFVASSSAIYGKTPVWPVREEDDCLLGSPDKACWAYSVGKLAEEQLAMAYHREAGTRVKIGRFFNVIGPHQSPGSHMVVPSFVAAAIRGLPLKVYGDGRQTRTFVYVEDALDGLERILERGTEGLAYNIGGTEEIEMLALARRVVALAGSASPIEVVPYGEVFSPGFEETARRVPDIGRLRALGYSPRYSLDEALRAIIGYHRRDA